VIGVILQASSSYESFLLNMIGGLRLRTVELQVGVAVSLVGGPAPDLDHAGLI